MQESRTFRNCKPNWTIILLGVKCIVKYVHTYDYDWGKTELESTLEAPHDASHVLNSKGNFGNILLNISGNASGEAGKPKSICNCIYVSVDYKSKYL